MAGVGESVHGSIRVRSEAGDIYGTPGYAPVSGKPYCGIVGKRRAIVHIHGSMRREDRAEAQESFRLDPKSGFCSRLMPPGRGSTYSGPILWSTMTCHGTPIGSSSDLVESTASVRLRFATCGIWLRQTHARVRYTTASSRNLTKLEPRSGAKCSTCWGRLVSRGKPLRELLLEAIKYGEQPEVRGRLTQAIDNAFNHDHLRDLWEEKALAHDVMDTGRLHHVRERMERAEASGCSPITLSRSSWKHFGDWVALP